MYFTLKWAIGWIVGEWLAPGDEMDGFAVGQDPAKGGGTLISPPVPPHSFGYKANTAAHNDFSVTDWAICRCAFRKVFLHFRPNKTGIAEESCVMICKNI